MIVSTLQRHLQWRCSHWRWRCNVETVWHLYFIVYVLVSQRITIIQSSSSMRLLTNTPILSLTSIKSVTTTSRNCELRVKKFSYCLNIDLDYGYKCLWVLCEDWSWWFIVIGASGFYVWPFNCDAPSSSNVRSRNITIFVESIRIRLISRIINEVIELSPLSYNCTS